MSARLAVMASHRGGLVRGCMALCLFLAAGMAQAQVPAQQDTPQADEDAVALLDRIQRAASRLDYSGIFTRQYGNELYASRIVHILDGTGERERVESLDGERREFLRHNDEVQCLMPEQKTVYMEKHRQDRFPGLLREDSHDIGSHYTVVPTGEQERVAGHACNWVALRPVDDLRYGYRLCVDTDNDLLLKRQTFDTDGQLVEQVAFNMLQLGDQVQTDWLKSDWAPRDWKVVEPVVSSVDLAGQGWRIPVPPGFRPVLEVERMMGPDRPVSQWVLSDGLSALSVFIELYKDQDGERHPKGTLQFGAVHVYGARLADFWLTAVGEVPARTLQRLVQDSEYVPRQDAAPR